MVLLYPRRTLRKALENVVLALDPLISPPMLACAVRKCHVYKHAPLILILSSSGMHTNTGTHPVQWR